MGIYKFNIVAYEGVVPEHFACQDKVLSIDCGDNLIHIKSADFGRKVKFLFLCDITKEKTVKMLCYWSLHCKFAPAQKG